MEKKGKELIGKMKKKYCSKCKRSKKECYSNCDVQNTIDLTKQIFKEK